MEIGRVNGEKNKIRIENPFTLKVGQVFTGFGIGCGVGIGVGRPLNLGAIPMLNQVMSATRGATDAFSGLSRHANTSLRKLGAKNIELGVGCGVGFGHGFGVGLAVKPGVLNQIQSCLVDVVTKTMTKFGLSPSLALNQAAFPPSLQNAVNTVNTNQSSAGSMMPLETKSTDPVSQGLAGSRPVQIGTDFENTLLRSTAVDSAFGSRTEKVISNFLQNPVLKGEGEGLDEAIGRLQSEKIILQMVLKHQKIIEDLVEENERLRRILMEDLKVPSRKFEGSSSGTMPMLDKVMSITKGATDGISSVSQQANTSLRMLGTSSAQGAVGYGIGFGHGFGLGISMRAGVDTLQSGVVESMTKMTGLIPGLPFDQGALPLPETSKNAQLATKSADQISAGSMMQQATKSFDQISQESVMQLANKPVNQLSQGLVGSQPTKIGSTFDRKTKKVGLMQAENKLLQTVMKQQQLIDELTEENAKLCQILQVKDLKIPCTKLQPSSSDPNLQQFPSSEVNENGGSRPSR